MVKLIAETDKDIVTVTFVYTFLGLHVHTWTQHNLFRVPFCEGGSYVLFCVCLVEVACEESISITVCCTHTNKLISDSAPLI